MAAEPRTLIDTAIKGLEALRRLAEIGLRSEK